MDLSREEVGASGKRAYAWGLGVYGEESREMLGGNYKTPVAQFLAVCRSAKT
jgi:hypothetical protein